MNVSNFNSKLDYYVFVLGCDWMIKKIVVPSRAPFFLAPTANGKRQTSDSYWEFLKIENEQIKTAQNNSHG